MLNLEVMTSPELSALPADRTIFVMVVSPVEVHGPHLPLGTDVMVATEVGDRAVEKLKSMDPSLEFVAFPPYYLGSDTIPGSVDVNSRALYYILKATVLFLKERGFKYVLLLDNHGGPRHQIATAKAIRKAYQKYGVYVVAPYLSFYRKIVENDAELLSKVKLGAGTCGDVEDSHAGQDETSRMLCINESLVSETYKSLERTRINTERWPAFLLKPVSFIIRLIGLREVAADIDYVAQLLCWVTEKIPPTYIGEPKAACAEAGDRMLNAIADEAVQGVLDAFAGKEPFYRPKGWTLRFIESSRL